MFSICQLEDPFVLEPWVIERLGGKKWGANGMYIIKFLIATSMVAFLWAYTRGGPAAHLET